jgi:tetratricopeptide (TPR) repeat protein
MVYRIQLISTIELESLKNAEGGFIATTSFFSTTKDSEVVHFFGGNGAKPPNQELVMFEICIEQSDLEERRPFADISEVSSKKDEDEILLCMGTVMHVESVELGEDMTRIRLRTCPHNDSAWQHSEVDLVPCESLKTNDETLSLFKLGYLLLSMGEFKKGEQFLKMIKSSYGPTMNEMCQLLLRAFRLRQNLFDPDLQSNVSMVFREMQKLLQLPVGFESLPDSLRETYKLYAQNFANCIEFFNPKDIRTVSSVAILQKYNEIFENMQKYVGLFALPSLSLPLIKPIPVGPECTESNDEQMKSKLYDKLRLTMDKILVENDPSRPTMFLAMAKSAAMGGNHDQAIALAREGLSMTCSYDIHVALYEELVRTYEKQKNWLAVIESCQSIIDMPQIAPSSSSIVKAYLARGKACTEFGDLSEVYISYINALQLQDQHQTPNHPLTSEIYIKIGDVFKQIEDVSTALEYYQKAISCGLPDTSSEAYKKIGIMYMFRRNYDLARSNFMKCLEIQQNSIPHETFLLAYTYTLVAQVEHRSGRIHQRDLNIQQARTIVILDEDQREFIVQRISKILAETVPTTS